MTKRGMWQLTQRLPALDALWWVCAVSAPAMSVWHFVQTVSSVSG
jgi:hypothetical protein